MTYNCDWKISEVRDEYDDDKLNFLLYEDGCVCGSVEIEVLYESYDYEFMNILSELEFAKEFRDEPIVKISRIEVEPMHRGKGIATYLLSEVFKRLRLAGFTQWFLNASPLDENGPNLIQLESFYNKYGFHSEQIRDKSTLMWFKDEI
jgi:GNAT superfamily N-acetyltransferase